MLTDLRLQHFRSYKDDSFEFQPGVNIIVGPNASGKTNLLEAILVLASGSSYRAKDSELMEFNQPWTRLDCHSDSGNVRTFKLARDQVPPKIYEIDGRTFQRLTLKNSLPVVLFEPNHLQLLAGSPEQRRAYLDDLLEQTQPGFGVIRRRYKRTLAQRNALLKQSPLVHTAQLFPWNIRLSQLAGQIVRMRCDLVGGLNGQLGDVYNNISQTKAAGVAMEYLPFWPPEAYETNFLKKLEVNAELDSVRGFTSIGPHREDFRLLFNNRLASDMASRGETRTAVLALKIIELRVVESARQQPPLLLLDDVFSELDGGRRRALTEYLRTYQTFITTTDADVVIEHFTETTRIIPLSLPQGA
jgi:DNA replication and repair protein RecF